MNQNYAQIIGNVSTPANEALFLRFMTLLDPDPHWLNNTKPIENYRQTDQGTHVLQDFPDINASGIDVKAFVQAYRHPQTDINTPEFAFLKTGKGIHAGMTQTEFDELRTILVIDKEKPMAAILATMGLTEKIPDLTHVN
jgi:hypothetical protein